jgi:hypothetical protein
MLQNTGNRAEAAFAARDLSVDFAKMGLQTKWMNQIIPFFNATIQGGDNTVEKALLGETTVKMLGDMFDIMKDIMSPLKTLSVILPSGVVNPAVPAQLEEVEIHIELLKKKLDELKSKNLKNS